MPEKIVQLNKDVIKGQIKELVRDSVEDTLNELLEDEAEKRPRRPIASAMSSAGVPERPLQPGPYYHLRRCYIKGTQTQRNFV